MSKTELKPCPFCGEENNIYLEKYKHTAGERWRILCANCMAQIDRGYDQTQWGVIEAWNTRKPMDRILKQLKELCKRTYYKSVNGNRDEGIRNNAYHNAIDIVKAGGVE